MANRVYWNNDRKVELVDKIEAGYTKEQLMRHFSKTQTGINNAINRFTFGMRYHRNKAGLPLVIRNKNGFGKLGK